MLGPYAVAQGRFSVWAFKATKDFITFTRYRILRDWRAQNLITMVKDGTPLIRFVFGKSHSA